MPVSVPSAVQHACGLWMVLGPFSDVLRQHVGDLGGRCPWVVPQVVCCVVQAIDQKCNGGELIGGLYVGITKEPAVEIGKEMRWKVELS